ncbi:MAG: hypothetical protein J3Q66DRAFT_337618 [Benniella sp.]|nr:MAG: hypothetical protein J3Q66DRAFT_337618 [Benniella sp.]
MESDRWGNQLCSLQKSMMLECGEKLGVIVKRQSLNIGHSACFVPTLQPRPSPASQRQQYSGIILHADKVCSTNGYALFPPTQPLHGTDHVDGIELTSLLVNNADGRLVDSQTITMLSRTLKETFSNHVCRHYYSEVNRMHNQQLAFATIGNRSVPTGQIKQRSDKYPHMDVAGSHHSSRKDDLLWLPQ